MKLRHTLGSLACLSMIGLVVVMLGNLSSALGQTKPELDPRWLLFPAQDESSTEKRIAKYIETVHRKAAKYKFTGKNDNDAILIYTLEAGSAPKLRAFVDTMVSSRNRVTRKVTERAVVVRAYFKLPASAKRGSKLARILMVANLWVRGHTYPHRIYLDKDKDVTMECLINIPGENIPIHAEMIYDAMTRMISAWEKLYKALDVVIKSR